MNLSKAQKARADGAAPEAGPIDGDVTSAGMTIQSFLELVVQHAATDLHISADSPPMMRVDGELSPLPFPALTATETKSLCYSLLTDKWRRIVRRARYAAKRELRKEVEKSSTGRKEGE